MECWINFAAPVELKSMNELTHTLGSQISSGIKKFHIAIASPGGSTRAGVACYNFLRMYGVEVVTYNMGSVESSAVPIFLAGTERVMSPNSYILVHRPKWLFKSETKQDYTEALEVFKSLNHDAMDMAEIISEKSGLNKNRAMKMLIEGKVLGPKDAVKYGLATKIEIPSIQPSIPITTIRI